MHNQVVVINVGSMPGPGGPLFTQHPPSQLGEFAARQSCVSGAFQIACGVVGYILNIIGVVVGEIWSNNGYGFWCPTFYIIAGGLCLGAAKQSSQCMVVACMTLSVIAAVFAGVHLGFASYATQFYASWYYPASQYNMVNGLVLSCLHIVVAMLEIAMAVWASVNCCKVTCCGMTTKTVMYPGSARVMDMHQDQQQQQQQQQQQHQQQNIKQQVNQHRPSQPLGYKPGNRRASVQVRQAGHAPGIVHPAAQHPGQPGTRPPEPAGYIPYGARPSVGYIETQRDYQNTQEFNMPSAY